MSLFRNLLIEKKRRKYYCEVEFLESTGTQWINAGINVNTSTDEIKLYFQLTETQNYKWFFGEYDTNARLGLGSGDGTDKRNFLYQQSATKVSDTQMYNKQHLFEINSNGGFLDGTKIRDYLSFASTSDIYLFNLNIDSPSDYRCKSKIWRYEHKRNGVLVRDFIPVLDWDMTPCMYDKVTEQLFYNQGTGSFVAGRQVHPVEYLESTGTQYINTGYIPTNDTGIQIKHTICADNGIDNIIFGCRQNSADTRFWEDLDWGNDDSIGWGYGVYSNLDPTYSTYRYKLISSDVGKTVVSRLNYLNSRNCSINDNIRNLPQATLPTITRPIYIFAGNNQGNAGHFTNFKVYEVQISEGSALVRDFIPAIDSEGRGFMFDRVTHTIYDNAGTGAFSYPAREVEYLQSDGARAIVAGVTVDDTCGYDVKWMALNSNDTIILGTKGSGDSRWVLSGSNNPYVNISWNTSSGGIGLGLNKIQTAQMNYFNDRKRILNDTPLTDITQTLSANASTYSVGIFGGYWGASSISLYSTCRIYYAKISKGTELIRDFIPMVKDGSPCLYDKVGGEYYFGIGTGSFTVGKIVEPEYE